MRGRHLVAFALLTLALLFAGCGRRRTATRSEQETAPAAPTSTKMQSPTVTMRDPQGKWTFSARAKTGWSQSVQEGPYTMAQATGTYEASGQPPVHMRANQIRVDKGAQRVTLSGAAKVSNPTVMVEGERMSYDLRTGKVQAVGPTKWTLAGRRAAGGASPGGTHGEKR